MKTTSIWRHAVARALFALVVSAATTSAFAQRSGGSTPSTPPTETTIVNSIHTQGSGNPARRGDYTADITLVQSSGTGVVQLSEDFVPSGSGTAYEDGPLIVRGVATGTEDTDAVNVGQLNTALAEVDVSAAIDEALNNSAVLDPAETTLQTAEEGRDGNGGGTTFTEIKQELGAVVTASVAFDDEDGAVLLSAEAATGGTETTTVYGQQRVDGARVPNFGNVISADVVNLPQEVSSRSQVGTDGQSAWISVEDASSTEVSAVTVDSGSVSIYTEQSDGNITIAAGSDSGEVVVSAGGGITLDGGEAGVNIVGAGGASVDNSLEGGLALNADDGTTSSTASVTATSAELSVTNADGEVHGVFVGTTSTVLSGGTSTAILTLDDSGAAFSDSNGDPIVVSGVANGVLGTDAVNVNQLNAGLAGLRSDAYAGIAISNAMDVVLPQEGNNMSMRLGAGYYGSASAYGLTVVGRIRDNVFVDVAYGLSTEKNSGSANGGKAGITVQW